MVMFGKNVRPAEVPERNVPNADRSACRVTSHVVAPFVPDVVLFMELLTSTMNSRMLPFDSGSADHPEQVTAGSLISAAAAAGSICESPSVVLSAYRMPLPVDFEPLPPVTSDTPAPPDALSALVPECDEQAAVIDMQRRTLNGALNDIGELTFFGTSSHLASRSHPKDSNRSHKGFPTGKATGQSPRVRKEYCLHIVEAGSSWGEEAWRCRCSCRN